MTFGGLFSNRNLCDVNTLKNKRHTQMYVQ